MAPPTVTDQVLSDAARTLTPDRSLDRAEAHAKYLFSTVTIFGTLLTGFGLISGNPVIAHEPLLLIVPLSLVCISLALSMYVLTPSRDSVNLDNLVEVQVYFGRRIRRRGSAIFMAGVLFAIALILVIPIVAYGNRNVIKASLTAKATRTADTDNVAATFKYEALPPGVVANVSATAKRTDGATVPVFEQISTIGDGGDLSGEISLPEGNVVKELVIDATAKRGMTVIHHDQIRLTLAPRPAPPVSKPTTKSKQVPKRKSGRG